MPIHPGRQAQSGAFVVEFALVLIIFFMFVFGVIEMARAMYLFNTLPEVTRRAARLAAGADFSSAAARDAARQGAIFRTGPGTLILGTPITDEHIRIDYLSLARNSAGELALAEIPAASLPSCPAQNRHNCLGDPHGGSCIRFVRARVCDPADAAACKPVPYSSIMPLITLPLSLPTAPTIANAEALGFTPGAAPSCL